MPGDIITALILWIIIIVLLTFYERRKWYALRSAIYFRQSHRGNAYVYTRNQQGGI